MWLEEIEEEQVTRKKPECEFCNAVVIISFVHHEPNCPTWEENKND